MDEVQRGFGPKVSASMAEWFARLTRRRLNMNVQETTGIRELTAQELDHVTGGLSYNLSQNGEMIAFGAIVGTMIMTAVGGLLEWLFG
jgi:hypothetical protein